MRREFNYNADGSPVVPWLEEFTAEDFYNDFEAFEDYLNEMADQYYEVAARLRPNEPHPMDFENSWDSPEYQSMLRTFELEHALDSHRAKHTPPPALPRNQAALIHGGNDAERAQNLIEMQNFIDQQLHDAAEHELYGRHGKARDCRERAAQYDRELKRLEKEPYSFEVQADLDTTGWGAENLDEMIHWDAKRLQDNYDTIKAMVVGYRQMAGTDFSYTLTGEGDSLQLTKIKHPDIPARELRARLGELTDEQYFHKCKAHGVETRTEPESPPEELKVTLENMTEADYDDYVKGQESKSDEAHSRAAKGNAEVAPGMFGGIQ